ncbi:alpha/beta hydrolase [Mycobacterium sp. 94-17]|uniref:alpha/beta fold hydrolase n=1 Tax=Mycobacterium sp. 94-17 TaxID=2986147 RepID=UPI002D1EE350|nr:alpha/beta hydrolase [Mycobacterium sp. 94-17]MEB4209751.1 alpha/beta hydrolase [Mycobacterium sp. 94-17]
MTDNPTIGIVLVHGAFHGPWCWEKVVPLLRADDVTIAVPDLYRSATPADPGSVQAEVDRLAQNGPVLVCGHSFGGYPITKLDPATVARLVYLCAFVPDDREWFHDLPMFPHFFEMVTVGEDGVMTTRPERARELFYNDCTNDDAAWAIPNMCSHTMDGASAVIPQPAWREVPSLYVRCGVDNVLTQEYTDAAIAHVGRGVRIPTGHSPMISRPDLVAALLMSEVEALRR